MAKLIVWMMFMLSAMVAGNEIPVIITYYHPVPAQTDSTPEIASCGAFKDAPKVDGVQLVAVSRDLFWRKVGKNRWTKRCGELVFVRINMHYAFIGMIWDTMNKRFTRRVDVLYQVGQKPKWGKASGILVFLNSRVVK